MVLCVAAEHQAQCIQQLEQAGETVYVLGHIEARKNPESAQVVI